MSAGAVLRTISKVVNYLKYEDEALLTFKGEVILLAVAVSTMTVSVLLSIMRLLETALIFMFVSAFLFSCWVGGVIAKEIMTGE